MRLAIQIVNWTMLVIGVLAVIDLIVRSNNGETGDGSGITIGLVWIAQSLLTLIYISNKEK
jgi:hypothetical protein